MKPVTKDKPKKQFLCNAKFGCVQGTALILAESLDTARVLARAVFGVKMRPA